MKELLVYAIGNASRGDDGLWPLVADELGWSDTHIVYQPSVEDSELLSQYKRVLFVDAAVDIDEEFSFGDIEPKGDAPFSSHSLSIPALLAVCVELYGKSPQAKILRLKGEQFELGTGPKEILPKQWDELRRAIVFE